MKDFSIKYDTTLQLDTIVPTIDLTVFHRFDSLFQADKKENINCQRFAFLKISKMRFTAHLLVAAFGGWASPITSKRAAISSIHFIIF
jgi:hypothetical protein